MTAINIQKCPTCRRSVNERQITLFTGMVDALWTVYRYCESRSTSTFKRKEVKHLFVGETQTARFGDWVLFDRQMIRRAAGGKKGTYLINMSRAAAFFAGELQIPTGVWKKPLTGEIKRENFAFVNEIKGLSEFLTDKAEFVAVYRSRERGLFY
jgi:hypothetical protein